MECKESGRLQPVVNFNKCEGKADCVAVCPYDVFEMRPTAAADKAQLNFVGKLKTYFHPNKAYVIDPARCHACGLCVTACPEKAIQLKRYG